MQSSEALDSGTAWRRYARQAVIGSLKLDLVPLEESHECQLEQFQDRLDAQTVYLRHGCYCSATIRKSPAWLRRQWNGEGQERFSQGAFLNGFLVGIGSIYVSPEGNSAEVALVVVPELQGLGRGGNTGVGGLLLEDLIRYARNRQLERVTAYLAVPNPRCQRLLRKYGFELPGYAYPEEESMAVLHLRRPNQPDIAVLEPGNWHLPVSRAEVQHGHAELGTLAMASTVPAEVQAA